MANLFQKFTGLLQDPAPDFVFEISETGVAWARPALSVPPSFAPIEPGVLAVSPLVDNVLKMDALADQIRAVTGGAAGNWLCAKTRRRGCHSPGLFLSRSGFVVRSVPD